MSLTILKEADFRKTLKAHPTGGYLFFGEEDYMKAATLRLVRQSITEVAPTMATFNDVRLDGLNLTPDALLDAMAAPPMGADRKLITITGLNLSTLRASELDKLCQALSELPDYPYDLVILSAAADTLDPGLLPKRPSELLTQLGEYLTPVWFERNTPAKLAAWVQKHYLHGGAKADPALCHFTVEYCGRNMFTLAGEIDKVACYVCAHGRDTVTEEDIRTAAIPAMEYDAFAFTNAIMERKRAPALDILKDLKLRRVEPLYILSEVSRVVCDLLAVRIMLEGGRTPAEIGSELNMHEYRVGLYAAQARRTDPALLRQAVVAADAADKALKRSAADGYGIIERLICSL